jgi:hypothetical protein
LKPPRGGLHVVRIRVDVGAKNKKNARVENTKIFKESSNNIVEGFEVDSKTQWILNVCFEREGDEQTADRFFLLSFLGTKAVFNFLQVQYLTYSKCMYWSSYKLSRRPSALVVLSCGRMKTHSLPLFFIQ